MWIALLRLPLALGGRQSLRVYQMHLASREGLKQFSVLSSLVFSGEGCGENVQIATAVVSTFLHQVVQNCAIHYWNMVSFVFDTFELQLTM
jgi:hypothetical protein